MNIRLHDRIHPRFQYQIYPAGCPDGTRRLMVLAFRQDGTLWLNPADIGVGPQHAPLLARFNAPYLLVNDADQTVLIDARAVTEVFPEPDMRRQWLEFVETVVRLQKESLAQYESARNN